MGQSLGADPAASRGPEAHALPDLWGWSLRIGNSLSEKGENAFWGRLFACPGLMPGFTCRRAKFRLMPNSSMKLWECIGARCDQLGRNTSELSEPGRTGVSWLGGGKVAAFPGQPWPDFAAGCILVKLWALAALALQTAGALGTGIDPFHTVLHPHALNWAQ